MIVMIIAIIMRLQNQLNNMAWESMVTVLNPRRHLL